MALTTIANGDNPSGTILQANFVYLQGLITGGQAIKSDTFANLRTTAAAAATTPFLCIATDVSMFMLYCGDTASGDGGFITLASWASGGIS